MTIQRMIELLEIEHECMLRGSHDDCDRNCADCDLVQDDSDLHEMYTDVIALLKEQNEMIPITTVAEYLADNAPPPLTVQHWESVMAWERFLLSLKGRKIKND